MGIIRRIKYDSLQAFRGVAALGVVLHHTAMSTNDFIEKVPLWLNAVLSQGFLGVDFFFVLSGFIIMSSHYDDKKSFLAIKAYIIKRFVRIYPPYWPVSIALLAAYSLLPTLSKGVRGDLGWVSSLFLVPDASPPALPVAWTLIHEVVFYAVFCLYFYSSRVFLAFLVVWGLSIGLMYTLGAGGGTVQ